MLFIKELKKICSSFVYALFIGLLLFSWHENFYGVTDKEISASRENVSSVYNGAVEIQKLITLFLMVIFLFGVYLVLIKYNIRRV